MKLFRTDHAGNLWFFGDRLLIYRRYAPRRPWRWQWIWKPPF